MTHTIRPPGTQPPIEFPLPKDLRIEPTSEKKPAWMKLREGIVRAKGDPEETEFLLKTLRKNNELMREGKGDFVTTFGVLWALPDEIPEEHVDGVLEAAEMFLEGDMMWTTVTLRFIREAAARALGKVGIQYPNQLDRVISKLRTLGEHEGGEVSVAATETLGKIGVEYPDKIIPVLDGIAKNNMDYRVPGAVAEALDRIGERHPDKIDEIAKTLEILAKDKERSVRRTAARALGHIGVKHPDKIMQTVKRLTEDRSRQALETAALTSGYIGVKHPDKAMPTLKTLAEEEDMLVRKTVVEALGYIGVEHPNKAIPELDRLSKDEDTLVRQDAVIYLKKMEVEHPDNQEIRSILKTLSEEGSRLVREIAKEKVESRKGGAYWIGIYTFKPGGVLSIVGTGPESDEPDREYIQRIVGYREPIYATPALAEADKRMKSLVEVSQQLREEFPNVVGLVVFGSTEKGYMREKRDVDCMLVGENVDKDVKERLSELIVEQGLTPDIFGVYADVSKIAEGVIDNAHALFSGLFFGDREKLRGIQKECLKNITVDQWDNIRRDIIHVSTKISQGRGLTVEEIKQVAVLRTILYAPPDLETMRKQLGVN